MQQQDDSRIPVVRSAARCKVRNWFGFVTLNVNVDCYLGEEKADTQFIVSFERVSTDSGDIAYAWAPRTDPSVGPSYPAPSLYALHFTQFARSPKNNLRPASTEA